VIKRSKLELRNKIHARIKTSVVGQALSADYLTARLIQKSHNVELRDREVRNLK
jgi:hypothetical protein